MAVSNYYSLQSFPAAEDLLTYDGTTGVFQNPGYAKAVKLDANGKATAVHTAGDPILGVCIETNYKDQNLGICTVKGSKVPVRAGAAFAAGAKLTIASDGRFTTGGTTVVAVATEAASAADIIITAVLV